MRIPSWEGGFDYVIAEMDVPVEARDPEPELQTEPPKEPPKFWGQLARATLVLLVSSIALQYGWNTFSPFNALTIGYWQAVGCNILIRAFVRGEWLLPGNWMSATGHVLAVLVVMALMLLVELIRTVLG